jgi:heme-degrading monooxygenase HmoA
MIARVARFTLPSVGHREAAERNGVERVGPALAREPGFHAIYYGRTGELEALSISLFESREANEAAAAVMNAQPLLPGQVPELLPTPVSVAFYEVLSSVVRQQLPVVGRFGQLVIPPGRPGDAADRWGRDVFAPMLAEVAGLCQAYLLRSSESGERVALTLWEGSEAMRRGGETIGSWHGREAAAGRTPGLVGTDAVILTDLRSIVAGVPPTVATPA